MRIKLAPPVVLVLATIAAWLPSTARLRACPFCTAVSQTFSEEMESMDVVVLAELTEGLQRAPQPGSTGELPKSKFKVTELIKGNAWAKVGQQIEAHYFGKPDKNATYLIMGTDPPHLMWSTPLSLSPAGRDYLLAVANIPKDSPRLEFFIKYLENGDEMLARDAYDEFANAPYADVIALREKIDRQQLVAWIQDSDVPVSRRRLYLTMLGVAGTIEDTEMLEAFMRSTDRKQKAGLDAMIACYLTLKGAEGMPLIEELFLGNGKAEYSDTYAAIMAVRFHGTESEVIPRDRLLKGLRMVLDRGDLADLVIPDLARWEDWSVMPRLVELFKNADKDSNWVRVPVVNYLRACPLDTAKQQIEVLREIDPDAIARANTFFPFAQAAGPARGTDKTASADSSADADPTADDATKSSTGP